MQVAEANSIRLRAPDCREGVLAVGAVLEAIASVTVRNR